MIITMIIIMIIFLCKKNTIPPAKCSPHRFRRCLFCPVRTEPPQRIEAKPAVPFGDCNPTGSAPPPPKKPKTSSKITTKNHLKTEKIIIFSLTPKKQGKPHFLHYIILYNVISPQKKGGVVKNFRPMVGSASRL